MAHPVSINLFELLDLADSLSRGTFLKVVVFIVAGLVIAFGVVLHERKRAKADRRARNARAGAEQEARIDAGRAVLHRDGLDAVDRLIADVFKETAQQQMLRRGVCPPDLHDVFEDGDRD